MHSLILSFAIALQNGAMKFGKKKKTVQRVIRCCLFFARHEENSDVEIEEFSFLPMSVIGKIRSTNHRDQPTTATKIRARHQKQLPFTMLPSFHNYNT